jgi:hypothetical protein
VRTVGWIVLVLVLLGALAIVFLGVLFVSPGPDGYDFSYVGVRLIVVGGIIAIAALAAIVALARYGRPR